MRSKSTLLIAAPLAAALMLVLCLESRVQRSTRFAAGLEWAGKTSDYSAFYFSLTNQSLASGTPQKILFQWVDRAGSVGSCHAELYHAGTQDNGVLVAYIGVPADAKRLRVLLCKSPGPARQRFRQLVEKLPFGLQGMLPRKWVYTDEVYSLLLPWTANPTLQATAAPGRS